MFPRPAVARAGYLDYGEGGEGLYLQLTAKLIAAFRKQRREREENEGGEL